MRLIRYLSNTKSVLVNTNFVTRHSGFTLYVSGVEKRSKTWTILLIRNYQLWRWWPCDNSSCNWFLYVSELFKMHFNSLSFSMLVKALKIQTNILFEICFQFPKACGHRTDCRNVFAHRCHDVLHNTHWAHLRALLLFKHKRAWAILWYGRSPDIEIQHDELAHPNFRKSKHHWPSAKSKNF